MLERGCRHEQDTCPAFVGSKQVPQPFALDFPRGGQRDAEPRILICGDFNARTAEEPDFLRMAELQPFLPTALDEDELPDYIRQRRNKDLLAPGSQTWGLELLEFC